jgi:hypothetical protein
MFFPAMPNASAAIANKATARGRILRRLPRQARRQLYENPKAARVSADPHREVLEAVKASIERYIRAFRLEGVTSTVRSHAPGIWA